MAGSGRLSIVHMSRVTPLPCRELAVCNLQGSEGSSSSASALLIFVFCFEESILFHFTRMGISRACLSVYFVHTMPREARREYLIRFS